MIRRTRPAPRRGGSQRRSGFVLVTVLLVSAAIWTLLAGLLLAVRMQHLVAVTARDHRVARQAALLPVDAARGRDWWGAAPPEASSGGAVDGTCTWTLGLLERSSERARYAAEVRFGRATVALDATAHRPP